MDGVTPDASLQKTVEWLQRKGELICKKGDTISNAIEYNEAIIIMLQGYAEVTIGFEKHMVVARAVMKAEELNEELKELLRLEKKRLTLLNKND